MLYLIDSALISIKCYSYKNAIIDICGVPLFFILSSFPGGYLLAHYYPNKKKYRLPYVLLTAGILLVAELIMYFYGYFQYINWTYYNSFFLNAISFMAIFWLGHSLNIIKND
jgi:hypothetical protein